MIEKAYSLRAARQLGEKLLELMKPVTERVEIVGSVRREKKMVHDLEILFVPKLEDTHEDMFEPVLRDRAELLIEQLYKDGKIEKRHTSSGHPTWGKQNKLARHVRTDIPIDFFAVPEKNWFVSLVIRTGPKSLNLELIKSAHERGLHLHAYGVFTKDGTQEEIIPKSEREVFKLAGVDYLDPEDRK